MHQTTIPNPETGCVPGLRSIGNWNLYTLRGHKLDLNQHSQAYTFIGARGPVGKLSAVVVERGARIGFVHCDRISRNSGERKKQEGTCAD